MDMEEIILEHMGIKEWVDKHVKEVKERRKNRYPDEEINLLSYGKIESSKSLS